MITICRNMKQNIKDYVLSMLGAPVRSIDPNMEQAVDLTIEQTLKVVYDESKKTISTKNSS